MASESDHAPRSYALPLMLGLCVGFVAGVATDWLVIVVFHSIAAGGG